MSASLCNQRDAYLGRWLTGPERASFEAHLACCPDCRQFVEDQEKINRLLAQAVTRWQPRPSELTARVQRRLGQARRQRIAWLAASAAAILLVAVFGVRWARREPPRQAPQRPVVEVPPPRGPSPAPDVRVSLSPNADLIAVPVATRDPSVTILWLYSTIPVAEGLERPPAPPSRASKRSDS